MRNTDRMATGFEQAGNKSRSALRGDFFQDCQAYPDGSALLKKRSRV